MKEHSNKGMVNMVCYDSPDLQWSILEKRVENLECDSSDSKGEEDTKLGRIASTKPTLVLIQQNQVDKVLRLKFDEDSWKQAVSELSVHFLDHSA